MDTAASLAVIGQLGVLYVVLLVFAPVVNSLIQTAISAFKELGRNARRTQAIDEARREMKFWHSWYELLEKPASSGNEAHRQRMTAELMQAADALHVILRPKAEPSVFLSAASFRRFRRSLPRRRQLLLLYTAPTPRAQDARRLFVRLLTAGLVFTLLLSAGRRFALAAGYYGSFVYGISDSAKHYEPSPAMAHGSEQLTNRGAIVPQSDYMQLAPASPQPAISWQTVFWDVMAMNIPLGSNFIVFALPVTWVLSFMGILLPLFAWWRMRRIEVSPKPYKALRAARAKKRSRRVEL